MSSDGCAVGGGSLTAAPGNKVGLYAPDQKIALATVSDSRLNAVGPNYDPERIGLAAVQPDNRYIRTTTDCTKGVKGQGINSGNSRCGHNFGTNLSPEDKAALLAYLRML